MQNAVDWLDFLKRVPTWEQLTPDTRQALTQMKSGETVGIKRFGDDLRRLTVARFVSVLGDGRRAKLHPDWHAFVSAVRGLRRHDILEAPNAGMLAAYLRDHFTRQEQAALSPDRSGYYGDLHALAQRAMSVGWLNDFLSLDNLEQTREWESARQPGFHDWRSRSKMLILDRTETFRAAQSMIKQFMSWSEPVPLGDLPERFEHLDLPVLAVALSAGIRYLFLFPAVRFDDMSPVITLWPTIRQRLHRPKAKPPGSVVPDQTFRGVFLIEDMTTVLVVSAGEVLRVRSNDHSLFSKAQKHLESNLMSIPEWVTRITGGTPPERVRAAMDFLKQLRFIEPKGVSGKDLRFEPTAEGRDWLGKSGKDRLKTILDHLKPDKPTKPRPRNRPGRMDHDSEDATDASRFAHDMRVLAEIDDAGFDDEDDEAYDDGASFEPYYYQRRPGFLPWTMGWTVAPVRGLDLPAAMASAYGSLARRRFVSFREFVDHHAQQANPLLNQHPEAEPRRLTMIWSGREPTDEEKEELWARLLNEFFGFRLLPLGGAQVGREEATGALSIALTDVGRYFLDLASDFDHDLDPEGHVMVQPNFDVVFLSPAPLAEATLARFAERRGRGTGTLFRITKKSIFKAASTKMTSKDVLETLAEVSAKPVPANVAREIQGWFGQCSRVAIGTAVLIHCPDAKTASRVLAAGGKKLVPVSDTVVELADHEFQTTLVKKLKEAGVFVDPSSPTAAGSKERRRRSG